MAGRDMKALVATGGAGLVDFANVPIPYPGAGEVLVDVRAVSVNRGELHRLLEASPGWRPGWDFAGVVSGAAFDGAGLGAGSRVFGIALGQSWAEQIAVPMRQLAIVPEGVSWEQAAALPTAALTALRLLRLRPEHAGRSVLVTGAAGGVGRFAVQLARRAGAKVTAVVGHPDRIEGLDELGADEISVGTGHLAPGFDLILESVGGDSLSAAFRLVGPGGMVVSFGNSSRDRSRLEVSDFYPKQATLRGFYVLTDLVDTPPADDLQYLIDLVAAQKLRADVAAVAHWRDAPQVLRRLQERHLKGKAVLLVGAGGE